MKTPVQLEFNFASLDPDGIEPWRKTQLLQLIAHHQNNNNTIYIYKNDTKLYLGKRTFVYEVDHTMFEEINFFEANWLNKKCNILYR